MSEFKLRFATDELERARATMEAARMAWLVARAASPSELDLGTMEAYCDAANHWANAERAYELALREAQAEWQSEWEATHATRRDREVGQEAERSLPDLGESPAETLSPVVHRVRPTVLELHRED